VTSERDQVLENIHGHGYWRVVIRPSQHEEFRIPTLSACRDHISAAHVTLRGWDYPHLGSEGPRAGNSWVEEFVDWQYGHIEFWRMYLSAQFVHHFAMREDYEATSRDVKGLDFINTVFTFTELFEFAARLAARGLLAPSCEVGVGLHDCKGRRIISWDPGRYLSGDYVCTEDTITYARSFDVEELIAHSREAALDATIFVLERFNWATPASGILAEEQAKLVERRRE
jgi:hypothetical protein